AQASAHTQLSSHNSDDSNNHSNDLNNSRKIRNAPYDHELQVLEGCDTLSKLWRQMCLSRGEKIAHREKAFGIWQSYS
ncbi:hypothetical protein R0K20_25805, partial [Staphylococcus sp. SIMBA_130]